MEGEIKRRFACGHCNKRFRSEEAVTNHIEASHRFQRVAIFTVHKVIDGRRPRVVEQSFAEMSIEASLSRSMGCALDDNEAWLADMAEGIV